MRKVLFALSAWGAFAAAASAQSSVTLYGIVDAGLTFNSNAKGGRQYALTSGNNSGSRWGLKGSEDLGGGLKAIFTAEGGFNTADGKVAQNGTTFGRQVFAGLSSERFGTLTFGRQYSTVSQTLGTQIAAGGPWGASSGARYRAHPGDLDNLDDTNRINNAVVYKSPNLNGFHFHTLYSFGGQAGDFTRNQVYDFSGCYAGGPLLVAAGYFYAKDPNYSMWGNKAGDSPTGNNIKNPVLSGYASAGSQQILSVGAAYAFGPVTVGMVYSNTQFNNLGSVEVAGLNPVEASYRGKVSFDTGEINAHYQVSPSVLLAAAYTYTRNRGVDGAGSARYHQVDLGTIYSLSKRTSLYLIGVFQAANGTDSTGHSAVAAINSAVPSNSDRQVVATMGITHQF
jgi:predicted porin